MVDLTIQEQDIIWSRGKRPPDMLLYLGSEGKSNIKKYHLPWISDHRLHTRETTSISVDSLLSSLFYIELTGVPVLHTSGISCCARVRCRLTPSEPALIELIDRLLKAGAHFVYDGNYMPCADLEAYEGVKSGIAYSRYFEFTVNSLSDSIDIKVSHITRYSRSISNCPYMLQTLIKDQGLECVFGRKDHRSI
jgi:hypothetical protein